MLLAIYMTPDGASDNNNNGNNHRFSLANKTTVLTSSFFIAFLILISIMFVFVTDSKNQSAKNGEDIAKINRTLVGFVDNFQERQVIGNMRANMTQDQLLNITGEQNKILAQQISNERNILGNLTAHRHVANFTRDQVLGLENQTNKLIEQLNATNEAGRGEAVREIIDAVNNNTILLKQLFNKTG
jgi:hypothetical protein